MMVDLAEMQVRHTKFHRMPKIVVQNMAVRVLCHTPGRVELQIRHPKHYAQASMTPVEAREIAAQLIVIADNAEH